MSAVSGAGGLHASQVRVTDDNLKTGTVSFGGVNLSASEAAQFVMMHRTEVMKKVGADRTELAQKHLDRIKTARKYLTELIDLKKFADSGKSYKDRVPVTPDMISFLKNEVGCSPGEFKQRLVFYGSAVGKLPEPVRKHYGMLMDRFGVYKPHASGGKFGIEEADGSNQWILHGVTCVSKDKLDSLKEEVNNYIDQQNDSNNLFMTQYKSVVNTMNESLEGLTSLEDKSHETTKKLVSTW